MQDISLNTALILLSFAALQGCSWVDSTGNPVPESQSDAGFIIPLTEFQSSIKPLWEGIPTTLLENTTNRVSLKGLSRRAGDWTWNIIEVGDHARCEGFEGYRREVASDSLEDACASRSQCDLDIEGIPNSEEPLFVFTLPTLKAPVALTYLVSNVQDDGTAIRRTQTICALAINEAPSADDDHYRALAGVRRIVSADDADNLLANDSDDVDARNQPLSISRRVLIRPEHADVFALSADGGFVYRAASDTPLNSNGEQTDSFVYSLSDGLHEVNATVTITIVASNNDPILVQTLPDALLARSATEDNPAYEIDISSYFDDIDNNPLHYNMETGDLPEGLQTKITDDGLITIYTDNMALAQQSGQWQINVTASDGLATTTADFQLTLIDNVR